MFGSRDYNKPSVYNSNLDIERSSPRSYVMEVNKPNYCLNISDVAGSSPRVVKFLTARKGSNPLNPTYQLPHAEIKPATPVKFKRDTLKTDDISGASPKNWNQSPFRRDTLNVRDIDGATSHQRTLVRKNSKGYESFEYKDVT